MSCSRKNSLWKRHVAYVLNSKEIQALFKEIDEYPPALNAEVFHRLALEYKILFRMILCCGLRVSEARILQTNVVDFEKGILRIHPSKGSNDQLVYLPEELRLLGNEYLKTMAIQYKITSEWFFPASDPKKVLQVASIGKRFHQFWERTSCAQECALQPTVPSLRHTFVVLRMNDWMRDGKELNAMMPYLSEFLGHSSIDDTFYYYHQVEEAFAIVREKDKSAGYVIPGVADEN